MNIPLEAVEAAALKLPADARAELIERLIDSVVPAPPLHPAWAAEIEWRIAELDAGLIAAIPADQAMAELRAIVDAREPKA